MKKLDKRKKNIIIIIFLPLLFITQYYLFKVGIISPMIKGVDIKIIQGAYIQDIDKYVVKLGDEVTLSAGNYIKIPTYAKDPKIRFSILDNSKTIKLEDNSDKEENTVKLKALKKGYTSVALMKNSRVLQKVSIRVVDPNIESLNLTVDGNLKYVGDEAEISTAVEADYKEFNKTYKVTYESSNENVIQIENNKIKAVGVGIATVYAQSKDKAEAIRYNIVARLREIEVKHNVDMVVGETIRLNPKVITSPLNLRPPLISYKFSQSKLPIERAVTFDDDGTIVGIRAGREKITISCGEGENKRIEVVNINVKEGTLENTKIRNLLSQHMIQDNKLKILLSWDILENALNYDIYIKNNLINDSTYDLYKSITQEEFLQKSNVMITIDLKENLKDINYDIYVVARNEEGTSKPSNTQSIKENLVKKDDKDDNNKKDDEDEDDNKEESKDDNEENDNVDNEKPKY